MPTTQRRVDLGDHHGRYLLQMLARELRSARLSAGVSQKTLGQAVGISGVHLSRIERGRVPGLSVLLLARLFAVLGHRLSARPYPEGPPIRDVAHARLLTRFKARLPGTLRFRTEVPLGQRGDTRAWDAEIGAGADVCKLEAETALLDLQATDRRIALKMDDDRASRVILLVAATQRNRRVLREFRELVAHRYPLETRAVMQALRAGRLPPRSGIVLI